jgi:hypothetical protein
MVRTGRGFANADVFPEPLPVHAFPAGGIGGGATGAPAANFGGYRASTARGSDPGAAHGGSASGDIADYRISEGSGAVVTQPGNADRDAEIERQRKRIPLSQGVR